MTPNESADFVTELMDSWSGTIKPEHTAQWFTFLEQIDDFGRAMRALADLKVTKSYRPAIADFASVYHELEVDDARYAERMGGNRRVEVQVDEKLNRVWLERVKLIRTRGRQLEEHDHRAGASGCPVCSVHTHQDGAPCARCDEIIGELA